MTGARPPGPPSPQRSMEDDLEAWGKVAVIETRGRRSGLRRRARVGFLRDDDGSLRVAATDDETHWAQNLLASGRCHVVLNGRRQACRVERLEEAERHATVAALIMRYGTPAERLGGGPAFRLVPIDG